MRLLPEIRNLIGNYHVKSGVYHFYRNEYMQAVDYLRKALRDKNGLSESDARKARLYLTLALMDSATRRREEGDLERAIAELESAAEVSPDYPDIHFRLGRVLEDRGLPEQAAERYSEAARRKPSYVEAHVALGFCRIGLGQHEAAAKAFRQALKERLAKIEDPFQSGIDALESGDAEAARTVLHQVFLASPRRAAEHVRAARKLLRDEDFEGALVEFDQAAELNPGYPDVHNYRGIALCELGRIEESIRAFTLSASLSPGYLVPRLNLAFAHLRAGEQGEAEAALEAVLQIDASETAARTKLAELRSVRVPEKRRPASRGR